MFFHHRKKTPSSSARRSKPTDKKQFWFGMIDGLARVVLGLWFALTAGIYFRNAYLHWQSAEVINSSLFIRAVDAVSIAAIGLFSFFIACLYAVRLQPINKFAGVLPAVTAILGAFLNWSLLLLKMRTDLPPSAKIAIAVLVLVGNIFGLMALRQLGRSFSILPEGRRLVTTGPYRYVRHPLYIAEAVASLGAMINFLSPLAVVIVCTQYLLQFARMIYEEKVLRATFPEYAAYAKRTARLIPGIY
jgi:protein-S-isoprenylcysteine O-methyltransferase Ste14